MNLQFISSELDVIVWLSASENVAQQMNEKYSIS